MIKAKLLRNLLLGLGVSGMVILGCKKDTQQLINDKKDTRIKLVYPDYFPQPHYNFDQNTLTQEGFELGKQLFYENALSITNNINCGSCHQPESAFAQLSHELSHGILARLGTRNSPSLFNLLWNTSFFWDGGVNHMELQPISPIINPDEMGETLKNVIAKLNAKEEYKTAFKKVFQKDSVDTDGVMKALSQFMGALVSANSKYDQIRQGKAGVQYTLSEARGYSVFQAKCNSCHAEPLFTDQSLRNNGLALRPNSKGVIDLGQGVITGFDSTSYYKFKVPTLRNLKYTYPYMHDGRFENLNIVLEHYRRAVEHTPNLDPLLVNGIPLSDDEKLDLLAFLNTLNDEEFVANPAFKKN